LPKINDMKTTIDLNADLGEGFLFDEELMTKISSCNIACGGHTGTENSMRVTIKLALKHKVSIGAHPSYPDPENFGRKEMDIPFNILATSIEKQIHQLINIARQEGAVVRYIKPHGALYNKAATDKKTAALLVDIVKKIEPSVAIMGLSGSELEKLAKQNYLMFIKEGFADRTYNDSAILVERTNPKALITNKKQLWEQVSNLILYKKVKSINNKEVALEVKSICFHGDDPAAIEHLNYVVAQLNNNKIEIKNVV